MFASIAAPQTNLTPVPARPNNPLTIFLTMPPREPKRARKNGGGGGGGAGAPGADGGDHLEIDYNARDGSSEESNAADDAPAAAAAAPLDNEVLAERCAAYVELSRKIKDLAAQITALRKTLKTQEKDLLLIMQTVKLEEINVDGVKITRIKRLQVTDE